MSSALMCPSWKLSTNFCTFPCLIWWPAYWSVNVTYISPVFAPSCCHESRTAELCTVMHSVTWTGVLSACFSCSQRFSVVPVSSLKLKLSLLCDTFPRARSLWNPVCLLCHVDTACEHLIVEEFYLMGFPGPPGKYFQSGPARATPLPVRKFASIGRSWRRALRISR